MDKTLVGNKTSGINIRLQPEVKDRVNRLAVKRGTTPSQLAREGLFRILKEAGMLPEAEEREVVRRVYDRI